MALMVQQYLIVPFNPLLLFSFKLACKMVNNEKIYFMDYVIGNWKKKFNSLNMEKAYLEMKNKSPKAYQNF